MLDITPGGRERSVIFLHGNVGIGSDWTAVLNAMAESGIPGRLLAPTLWDYFGQSRNEISFSDWAEWFCECHCDASPKPVLVGYSLGGRLALHAITRYPECFEGAVILCADTGMEAEERADRLCRDRKWGALASGDWKKFMDKWEAQPVFAGGDPMSARESLADWRHEIASAFDVWSLGRQENLVPLLSEITCPVLWISGERDARFTRMAARAAAAMRGGDHVVVAAAGHRVPWDQPAETARLIAGFLQQRFGARP